MVEQLSQCDASQRIVSRIWFEPVFEKAARASGGPLLLAGFRTYRNLLERFRPQFLLQG